MEEKAPPKAVQVVSFSDPHGEEETRKKYQDETYSTVCPVFLDLIAERGVSHLL